jgi:hypothetical protein
MVDAISQCAEFALNRRVIRAPAITFPQSLIVRMGGETGAHTMPHLARTIAACLLLLGVVASQSRSASATDWIAESPARRAMLVDLLKRGDYERLEQELTSYQSRHEAGELPEGAITNDYFAFRNSDAALEPRLVAWALAMPDSYAAALATGVYYTRLGWLGRGGKYARDTAPEQFAAMGRYFERAENGLQRALRTNGRLVLAYAELASIKMARGSETEMNRFLEAGLAKAPSSWILHRTALTALTPRWFGSTMKLRLYLLGNQKRFQGDPGLRSLLGILDFERGTGLWRREDYAGAAAAYTKALK